MFPELTSSNAASSLHMSTNKLLFLFDGPVMESTDPTSIGVLYFGYQDDSIGSGLIHGNDYDDDDWN